MNKEIGYIIQGFLMVSALAIVFKVAEFSLSLTSTSQEKQIQIDPDPKPLAIKPALQKGAKLFRDNCASCHTVNKDLAGPALEGVEDRIPDRKLLYQWIRNSSAVLQSGNDYFEKLYTAWNKTPMNSFPHLNDGDIDAILDYIKGSSGN